MLNLSQEVRHAARKLRNSPGFTLVSILTLALGIGATATVFSVVEAVLLRPLPFHDPDRLVALQEEVPQLKETGKDVAVPAPDAIAYAQNMQSFDHAGGYIRTNFEVSGIGEPVELSAARLSAGVFPCFGCRTVIRPYLHPRRRRKFRASGSVELFTLVQPLPSRCQCPR